MDAAAAIGGVDIANIMTANGPIVNTVILRCPVSKNEDKDEQEDSKPAAVPTATTTEKKNENDDDNTSPSADVTQPQPRVVLTDLIEEAKIDTTPSKSKVAEVLGGPVTFLGQYEDEGVVLMIRKFPDDLEEINIEGMVEKSDLIKAVIDYQSHLPPYNTHQLQSPLHKARVRGDIVIMKVAETNEELDVDDDEIEGKSNSDDEKEIKTVTVPTNEEFFLNYTKTEYVKFASRTDIPEHEIEIPEDDDDDDDDDDEEEEEDENDAAAADNDDGEVEGGGDGEAFIMGDNGDDEEIDETDKSAMFNLVMNEVLRQYREENGRGPNTQELLELRSNIARELDVDIAHDLDGDWDKKANANSIPSAKKIMFSSEKDTVKEYTPDPNEYKSDSDPDDVARSLGNYDEEDEDEDDDEDYAEEPPTKRIKTSEVDEEGESKQAST
ncbi:hypothetical protein FRACYDRAFT_234777 [Fragilariopsis cylindrus CCMP1102]|uniref:DUF5880 domain-containing protein n=1 Tax=Fragilariopsis cylindrus CCMP1102 TaxID=635003 RepID=A0A1E7FSJ9_9STRA|nr:hypothetical protein FRACYDRAFT_234777 [Fragilariopsis cylindrus CCMP1102]|eukprot:OEU21150.1 hypothetical protein FRACYDRAFT_234777 [Fragilariopsis cylindrus CCMP1102]